MKIYTIDNGWAGALAIVAESREEAYEIATKSAPYNFPESPEQFEEHEIAKGIVIDCGGDQ